MKPFRFTGSALICDVQMLWATLSPRKKEIARLAAQGKRTREIADELAVSPRALSKSRRVGPHVILREMKNLSVGQSEILRREMRSSE